MTIKRVELFGAAIDPLTMDEAVERLLEWIARPVGRTRCVVTPNVDHIVMLQRDTELQRAYRDADLVLADGWPVVAAARLLGRPLPERVAGSDLVPALFEAAGGEGGLRVFLLGAAPGVAQRAAGRIEQRWPRVRVCGVASPPLGFERDAAQNERLLDAVRAARPDVVVLGLGAPKQELWSWRRRRRLAAAVTLCAGATIDFLAGEKPRAPAWVRRIGMEWLHRVATEPRRLAARYARDAWVFPQLVVRQGWRTWRRRPARELA